MKGLILFLSAVALASLTVCAAGWDVLVVDAAAEPGLEFQFLTGNVKEVKGEVVNYTQTVTANLKKETLGNYDVVWLWTHQKLTSPSMPLFTSRGMDPGTTANTS